MNRYEVDQIFTQIAEEIENEQERIKRDAFIPEARPIPEGLVTEKGSLPLGHIALVGDFEQ